MVSLDFQLYFPCMSYLSLNDVSTNVASGLTCMNSKWAVWETHISIMNLWSGALGKEAPLQIIVLFSLLLKCPRVWCLLLNFFFLVCRYCLWHSGADLLMLSLGMGFSNIWNVLLLIINVFTTLRPGIYMCSLCYTRCCPFGTAKYVALLLRSHICWQMCVASWIDLR